MSFLTKSALLLVFNLPNTEPLLCVRWCFKCLTNVNSFNPYNEILLISLFCPFHRWGTEVQRLYVANEFSSQIKTYTVWLKGCALNHNAMLSFSFMWNHCLHRSSRLLCLCERLWEETVFSLCHFEGCPRKMGLCIPRQRLISGSLSAASSVAQNT